ncbi:MAG: GHMP kinase [Anaerolineae bacterium]|nr:GHMP kinase [Anaerolineae bacterium]
MVDSNQKPSKIIYSIAPIRICDLGGWTDTWFAKYGKILNIGVSPHAEVQIDVYPRASRENMVTLFAENYGERFVVTLGNGDWNTHPLLEATVERMGIPDDIAVDITLYSDAPAGASIGTSASVTVALVGALDLLTPGRLTQHEIAYAAQSVEVDMLGRQSGIQDQLAAAYGNINYIDMFKYPYASVSHIKLPNRIWWELNRRLVLIYLGKSHDSSQVHEQVIEGLENAGSEAAPLKALQTTPERARDALVCGNYTALGQVMIDNSEMQRDLHPALISHDADHIIDIAKHHGALGWKVNGAGGDGGSITLLCGDSTTQQRNMIATIEAANPLFQHVPIHLTRNGVYAWEVMPH